MRTFPLAASVWVAACCWCAEPQFTAEEAAQWKRVEPAVATVYQGLAPRGVAALIAPGGWFLAHRTVVTAPIVKGKLSTGKTVFLKIKAVDGPTQLVLLQAEDWKDDAAKPVKVAVGSAKPGDILFAVIPSGVIRAQFVTGDRLGVVGPSRRVIPLGEIRFEAPADKVGGALVFSLNGELVGTMQATLSSALSDRANQKPVQAGAADAATTGNKLGVGNLRGRGGFGGNGGSGDDTESKEDKGAFQHVYMAQGPAGMTVAYIVSPEALGRVVQGFISPSHEVVHPTLGIVCREAGGEGALIEGVQPGSPAEKAGLKPNDILEMLAGIPIRNQLDFARAMLKQEVGKTVQLKVKRDGRSITLSVVVGKGQTQLSNSNL